MAVLTANKSRLPLEGSGMKLTILPGLDAVKYYNGTLVTTDSTGRAVKAQSAAGMRPGGVLVSPRGLSRPELRVNCHLDMTSVGADGSVAFDAYDYEALLDTHGVYGEFSVGTGTAVAGAPAYAKATADDDEVDATAPANPVIVGWFTRPSKTSGRWYIDLSKAGVA